MSGSNGRQILKIERKGRRWFQLGDPPEIPEALQKDATLNQQTQIFLAELRAEKDQEKRAMMLCNLAPGEIANHIRQTVACEPVEIDVVVVHGARCRIDDKYTDATGKMIDKTKRTEWDQELNTFVCGLFGTNQLSGAEVLEFLHVVSEEVNKLRPFFEKESPAEQSSAGSTELIFST